LNKPNGFTGDMCQFRFSHFCGTNTSSTSDFEPLCNGATRGICSPCPGATSRDPNACANQFNSSLPQPPPFCQCLVASTSYSTSIFPFCGASRCDNNQNLDLSVSEACRFFDSSTEQYLPTGSCKRECYHDANHTISVMCAQTATSYDLYHCECATAPAIYSDYVGEQCNIKASACVNQTTSLVCNGHREWCVSNSTTGEYYCDCPDHYSGGLCENTFMCDVATCNLTRANCECNNTDINLCNSPAMFNCNCLPFYDPLDQCQTDLCELTGGVRLIGVVDSKNNPIHCRCPENSTLVNGYGCKLNCAIDNTTGVECGSRHLSGRSRCTGLLPANTPLSKAAIALHLYCNCSREISDEPVYELDTDTEVCKRRCLHCRDNPLYTEASSAEQPPCLISQCDAGLPSQDSGGFCQFGGTRCNVSVCNNRGIYQGGPYCQSCNNPLLNRYINCSLPHCENGVLVSVSNSSTEYECECQFPFIRNPNFLVNKREPFCRISCNAQQGVLSVDSGVLFDNYTCTCRHGFKGLSCDEYVCLPPARFNLTSQRCDCTLPQFTGTYCNESKCMFGQPLPAPSSGCLCEFGYTGALCDQNICGDFGTPDIVNRVCVCDPGYTTPRLFNSSWFAALEFQNYDDDDDTSPYHICLYPKGKNKTHPDACVVRESCPGFTNALTNEVVCPYLFTADNIHQRCLVTNCSGHGKVVNEYPIESLFTCVCHRGYGGSQCEVALCPNNTHTEYRHFSNNNSFTCRCLYPWIDSHQGYGLCNDFQSVCGELGTFTQGPPYMIYDAMRQDFVWQCNCSEGFRQDINSSPTCEIACLLNTTKIQNSTSCTCLDGYKGERCEIKEQQLTSNAISATNNYIWMWVWMCYQMYFIFIAAL
jgi:hypothetical protein